MGSGSREQGAPAAIAPVTPARRIAAVVLPDLLCEIATASPAGEPRHEPPLLGIVVVDPGPAPTAAVARLDAVSQAARRYGVREGQSIAEACALVARLVVREIERAELLAALGRIAEMALAFGPTVALEAPDTVWVDVTGSAHLMGGEAALAEELASRTRALGHVARVVVARGPRLAQAFARWSSPAELGARGVRVVESPKSASEAARLPIAALPIERERAGWLARLGVLTFGDLAKQPREAAAARLGESASVALDLCRGEDAELLVPFVPPALPVEEIAWEDPVNGVEPLGFALRGLIARLSARLQGRGESAQSLELAVVHDRSIALLRRARPELRLDFELAAPLWREADLRRVLGARLERARLEAPARGLRLRTTAVTRALPFQLGLDGSGARHGPEALPVLLAELGGDVGSGGVGVLAVRDAHRPEARSALVEVAGSKPRGARTPRAACPAEPLTGPTLPFAPTRLFEHPVPLDGALRPGALVAVDRRLYSIERIGFAGRLDRVEWWSGEPVSRDYLRVGLRGTEGCLDALVYVERASGRRFLQALFD